MVAHLLLATRMSAMEIVSLVMETHLSNFEIMQSKRRSSQRHTTQLGLHYQSGRCAAAARALCGLCAASERSRRDTPEKSEDYLTSPIN